MMVGCMCNNLYDVPFGVSMLYSQCVLQYAHVIEAFTQNSVVTNEAYQLTIIFSYSCHTLPSVMPSLCVIIMNNVTISLH